MRALWFLLTGLVGKIGNGSLAFHSDDRGFIVFFLRQGVRNMCTVYAHNQSHLFSDRDSTVSGYGWEAIRLTLLRADYASLKAGTIHEHFANAIDSDVSHFPA